MPIVPLGSIFGSTSAMRQVEIQMATRKTVRFSIEIAADLAAAVASAASTNNVTAEDIVNDCLRQQFETALRYRVLLQRQNDVDEALIELARLVGRLSAAPGEVQENICRYRPGNDR
ncbi:hypothetical protein ABIA06_002079 [Bradyrhizobium yuanmingense]|uniref:hypothetical protein n=1 Tax=Bradyrhizobium yuanmingense TaxID=108015 RepID=UPI00351646D6